MSTSPLFILGAPRSFTSVVCGMLGQHPQCYGFPELNLFTETTLNALVDRFSGTQVFQLHGLLRAVAQLYGGEQSIASLEMAWRWVLRRLERSTELVYQELVTRVGPRMAVDKSPTYCRDVQILHRIAAAFPTARYLYLVRHPVSQGRSMMNTAGGAMALFADSVDYSVVPAVVDPQIAWLAVQRNIQDFLASVDPSRQIVVRGEDLLNSPETMLVRICDWAGLRIDAAALDAMLHPERSPYACLGPINAHLGNDINFLRAPAFRHTSIVMEGLKGPLPWRKDNLGLRQEVTEMAVSLGYPLEVTAGNTAVAPVILPASLA